MIKRKFVDVGMIIEDHRGYQTIVMQNGETASLSFPFRNNNAKVGDKGNIYYESDGTSYGMHRFEIDNSISLNIENMKKVYKEKWNGELIIPESN